MTRGCLITQEAEPDDGDEFIETSPIMLCDSSSTATASIGTGIEGEFDLQGYSAFKNLLFSVLVFLVQISFRRLLASTRGS